jgi:hypothetical protein
MAYAVGAAQGNATLNLAFLVLAYYSLKKMTISFVVYIRLSGRMQ